MKRFPEFFFLSVLLASFGVHSVSEGAPPTRGLAPTIEAIYVPVGFDDDDDVEITIEGMLPTPCHKKRDAEFTIVRATKEKTGVIEITARAFAQVDCDEVPHTFDQTVNLHKLEAGIYDVRAAGTKIQERLEVTKTSIPEPRPKFYTNDSRPYAPVDNAYVAYNKDNELIAVIEGRVSNTCWDVRLEMPKPANPKTFQVFPIIHELEKAPNGDRCKDQRVLYRRRIAFPENMALGRYLLHVRTMEGRSKNVLFTNMW